MDLCSAIQNRKLVSFYYKGHQRVLVPGAYGRHKSTRNELLRAYQVRGGRNKGEVPGWGMYKLSDIRGFQILDETIGQIPPGYKHGDSHLSPIYCEL
jgi:hypothetical protein